MNEERRRFSGGSEGDAGKGIRFWAGMMHTAISGAVRMSRYFDLKASGSSFTYRLKHNAIQARTNGIGFFVLFTGPMIGGGEILKIYREKDVVKEEFMHSKPGMEPLYARTERGTRAWILLSILGYSKMRMIAAGVNCLMQKRRESFLG